MMKLGKADIMAIVECGLLFIGAIFLAVVFINPANPVWALWVGLLFAAVGVGMWVIPLIVTVIKKKRNQNILGEEPEISTETYELHRPAAVDNPVLNQAPITEPATTTTKPTKTKKTTTTSKTKTVDPKPTADDDVPPNTNPDLDLDF